MIAINYTNLRDNMKNYFDQIADNRETMIVTRKDENMVIMSQSSYDSLMESVYLISNKSNYDHITKGIKQHKNQQLSTHELIEDENA